MNPQEGEKDEQRARWTAIMQTWKNEALFRVLIFNQWWKPYFKWVDLTASPFSFPLGIHLRINIWVPNDHNSFTVCWKHLRALKERRVMLRKSNKSHLKTILIIIQHPHTIALNCFFYIFMRGCQIVNWKTFLFYDNPLAHPTHGKDFCTLK